MTSYFFISMLIIAAGVILFALSLCGFLRKWIRYNQEIKENEMKKSPTTVGSGSLKCVLHDDCSTNAVEIQGIEGPFYTIDLPPSYDDILVTPSSTPPKRDNDIIMNVDNLPDVHHHHVSAVSSSRQCELA